MLGDADGHRLATIAGIDQEENAPTLLPMGKPETFRHSQTRELTVATPSTSAAGSSSPKDEGGM